MDTTEILKKNIKNDPVNLNALWAYLNTQMQKNGELSDFETSVKLAIESIDFPNHGKNLDEWTNKIIAERRANEQLLT